MQFRLGKLFLAVVGFFMLLFIATFILVNVKKEILYSKALSELQKTLKADVYGDLSVSVFKHFPKVSIMLADVVVKDAEANFDFLNVEELTFKLYPWSLLRNSFNLSEIDIANGELNVVKAENGKWNLGIFNQSSNGPSKESWDIKDAMLYNIELNYIIESDEGVHISYLIESGKIQGNIAAKRSKIFSLLKGKFRELPKNFSAINGELSKLKINLIGKNDFAEVAFQECLIDVLGNNISLDGAIAEVDSSFLQIVMKGKRIEQLFSILPDSSIPLLKDFEGRADYEIEVSSHSFTSISKADWKAKLSIENGEIENKNLKQNLNNLHANVKAGLFAENADSNYLHVQSFKIKDKRNDLEVDFRMQPFKESTFDLKINGEANLEKIQPYLSDSLLSQLQGSIEFDNLYVSASEKDFDAIEDSKLKLNGSMKMDDLALTYNQIEYDNINGELTFDDRTVSAKDFMIQFLETDLEFNGKLANLLEYIFNLTQNRGSKGTPLIAEGELSSQRFDLGSIIDGFNGEPTENKSAFASKEEKISGVALEQVLNLQGNLKTNINSLVFDELELEYVKTNLLLDPAKITIEKMDCEGMDGEILAKGKVYITDKNTIILQLQADVESIDIKEMFRQCNNFGQNVLKNDHLNGELFAQIDFTSKWKNINQFQEDDLLAFADVRIENGTLNEFEPLSALSKHIALDELKSIKFASLKNSIKIKNSRIEIPEMEISSNVIKIDMSGVHKFNNWVDYRFKLNLKSLLAKKFNKKKPKDAISEPLPEGGLNLFIQMVGDLNDPKISFDKEGRKEKIKEDLKQQKEDLKNLFKEEKKGEPEQLEKEKFKIKKKPQYIDWDEDSTDAESYY